MEIIKERISEIDKGQYNSSNIKNRRKKRLENTNTGSWMSETISERLEYLLF